MTFYPIGFVPDSDRPEWMEEDLAIEFLERPSVGDRIEIGHITPGILYELRNSPGAELQVSITLEIIEVIHTIVLEPGDYNSEGRASYIRCGDTYINVRKVS